MATITGGPLTVVADSDEEYQSLLAQGQSNPQVEIVSSEESTRTIVFNLVN